MNLPESKSHVAIGVVILAYGVLATVVVGFIVYPPAGWLALAVVLCAVGFSGDTRG